MLLQVRFYNNKSQIENSISNILLANWEFQKNLQVSPIILKYYLPNHQIPTTTTNLNI